VRFTTGVDARSDAELVGACLAGDEVAWNELVQRFSRYVYAIAAQAFRLRDEDVEDVFQDVFACIYDRLDTLRDPSALRPWIGQLTRRMCIDRLRSATREGRSAETLEEEADDVLDGLEEAFDVRYALAALSPECREVLDRFFCQDQSYRTIGQALDLPIGTIASRISRCLGRLRQQLEGRNVPTITSSEQGDR
jgi:RNA polymerase sigma factor (sigma-70 family)